MLRVHRLGWLMTFAGTAIFLAGCHSKNSVPTAKSAAATTGSASIAKAPAKKWVIGMSQCTLGEPWRVQMDADIKKAASKYPALKVIFKDAQNSVLQQRAQIAEFVQAGVNLIIVSPKETAPLTQPLAKAYQSGIPVIVLDRAVLGNQYTCFIGASNTDIGRAAGKWIVNELHGKGNVVELEGSMTSSPGQERNAGFKQGIKGTQIHVIYTADMKWQQNIARREMESALTRFPDINLVYAANDPGAYGAYLAAKAAGRAKDMKFVGIDGLPSLGLAYIAQGYLDATFRYPTCGRHAIAAAWKILHGQKVPKRITLSSRLYTKANLAQGGAPLP